MPHQLVLPFCHPATSHIVPVGITKAVLIAVITVFAVGCAPTVRSTTKEVVRFTEAKVTIAPDAGVVAPTATLVTAQPQQTKYAMGTTETSFKMKNPWLRNPLSNDVNLDFTTVDWRFPETLSLCPNIKIVNNGETTLNFSQAKAVVTVGGNAKTIEDAYLKDLRKIIVPKGASATFTVDDITVKSLDGSTGFTVTIIDILSAEARKEISIQCTVETKQVDMEQVVKVWSGQGPPSRSRAGRASNAGKAYREIISNLGTDYWQYNHSNALDELRNPSSASSAPTGIQSIMGMLPVE